MIQICMYFRKPKATAIDEYKTRCQALKEQTNYVEPQKLAEKLKSKSSLDAGNHVVREMNQIQDSKYAKSLRRDLLGVSGNDPNNSIRQRVKSNTTGSGEDMNVAMKHHANLQEKIAEEMLSLTRNLKEQTVIANRIIRNDTEVRNKLFLIFFLISNKNYGLCCFFFLRLYRNPAIYPK